MDYLFIAIYLFVMSFILWLYHWHATLIAERVSSFKSMLSKSILTFLKIYCFQNDELRFALYSSPWHAFPVNVQKSIRLMMMESTTPLIMKAIFVELNLKTFIDVNNLFKTFFFFNCLSYINYLGSPRCLQLFQYFKKCQFGTGGKQLIWNNLILNNISLIPKNSHKYIFY